MSSELEKAVARWLEAKRNQVLREDLRGDLIAQVRNQERDVEDEIAAELERLQKNLPSTEGQGEIANLTDALTSAAGLCESESNRWSHEDKTARHWKAVAVQLRAQLIISEVKQARLVK